MRYPIARPRGHAASTPVVFGQHIDMVAGQTVISEFRIYSNIQCLALPDVALTQRSKLIVLYA